MNLNRFLAPIVLFALFIPGGRDSLAAGDPPPTPVSEEVEAELAEALSERRQDSAAMKSLTFELFTPEVDTAFTTPDGETAVLWLALRDDAGRLLATEPGLAVGLRAEEGWQVLLPGDPGWEEAIASMPEGMLPLEQSPIPEEAASLNAAAPAALTGYYLPYAAGTARWLEGSISHFQSVPELGYPSCSIDTCRYAYDFTDQDHFPLLASKEGRVLASRDWCQDGSTGCTNYIVLSDTNGWTYQIYLHLANGTIPDKLAPGTMVRRGQYLGDSDDTGYSTSQHVHFMVVDNPWQGGDGYYWGRSVDVRFADVAVNNGIPRNCYEVTRFAIYDGATECLGNKADPRNPANDWYVSGNVGAFPPSGALTSPAAGATLAGGSGTVVDIAASVQDDVRVTAVRLVAKIGGQWVEIGPKVTQPARPGQYDWDVDLCSAAGPINGPLEVALRAWDHEGNVSSALAPRTVQVDHACPPPSSQLKPAQSFNSTAVLLNWEAAGTAGIGSFELQWRSEPGNWEAIKSFSLPGSQRSMWFTGQPGGRYAFRLRARDANGQAETWPAGEAAETGATLPATCTADASEPDDAVNQARSLALGNRAQRNLCGSGNPDWFRVQIGEAGLYSASGTSLKGGAAVRITVYAEDGRTLLASGKAKGVGQAAMVIFDLAAAGSYYIKVEPLSSNLFGTDAVYGFAVAEAERIFLPSVRR